MHATTLLATTLAAMLARGAAQQCLACLGPACSATACSEGVTRDANGDLENDKLYLGGLFASTPGDIDGGPENVEHFLLTVAMINDKTDGWYDDLLPNTEIVTFAADSACSALPVSEAPGATYYNGATYYSQGAPGELWNMLMHHQATYDHNVDAVVGPACSGASNAAAYFAEEFKVPMVSYSATSKSLSGRSPYFFRLSAPDSEKSLRIVDFMASVDWTHVGIISTDTAYGKGMADNIKSDWLAHDSESKVEYRQIIDVDRDDVADKVEEAMSLLIKALRMR